MRPIPSHQLTKRLLLLVLCGVMTACMVVRQPSETELRALDHPPSVVKDKLDRFYPLTLAWYEEVERQLLPQGRMLSNQEKALAQRLGVKFPENVGGFKSEVQHPEFQWMRVECCGLFRSSSL